MTMRRGLIMSVAVMVLSAAVVAAFAAGGARKPKGIGIQYQVSTSVKGGDEVALTKVWIEGNRQRVEERGHVIIKVGDTVTRWSEREKEASRIKGVSEYYELSGLALPMHSRAFKQRAKTAGEETIGGRLCNVYYWTTPTPPPPPGETTKTPEPENRLWLSTKHRIPMKIVRSNLGAGSKTYVSMAKNIEVGINIPDTLFELPKGMKIKEKSGAPPKPRGKGR